MARYQLYGTSTSLFDSYSGAAFTQTLIYTTASEFRLRNSDGSMTKVTGSGFVWNAATGKFTAGTATAIAHFTAGNAYNDAVTNFSMSAAALQTAFEAAELNRDVFRQTFFGGNDSFDAGNRAGGAVTTTFMVGYTGNDLFSGGKGADSFFGGSGADTLYGFDGNDFLNGGVDNDVVLGGAGNDRLIGDGGNDTLAGSTGDDIFYGGAGDDRQMGDEGVDIAVYQRLLSELVISITPDSFNVVDPNGNDRLYSIERIATDDGIFVRNFATNTWVQLSMRPGIALIYPEQFQTLSMGADTINLSGTGKTIIMGLDGNDRIAGAGGADTLLGGNGNDVITGDISGQTVSNDRLIGEAGDDALYGYAGDDLLYGGQGNDQINGGDGNDRLWGDAGQDILTGGIGADMFVFTDDINGRDTITDFVHGVDTLSIDASAFGGGLAAGALAAGRLVSGAAPLANQAYGQFLYSTASGLLRWDADGTGAGAAVDVALLQTKPALTVADFLIVL